MDRRWNNYCYFADVTIFESSHSNVSHRVKISHDNYLFGVLLLCEILSIVAVLSLQIIAN